MHELSTLFWLKDAVWKISTGTQKKPKWDETQVGLCLKAQDQQTKRKKISYPTSIKQNEATNWTMY